MSIQYRFLSKEKELAGTALQVCSDQGESFTVLQYKAEGRLLYSHDRGMYSEDKEKQIKQIEEFLRMANTQGADLAITPEASVPLEVVEKIVQGEIRPEAGKLWCLGGEGINKEEFNRLTAAWDDNKEIRFICAEGITFRKYINAMFYFFRAADGRLAMVLQPKTGAMRDISFAHEQADLSLGSEIFIVDLNGDRSAINVLVSMICADILNINPVEFCETFHEKFPVVLNMQMNSKPYHGKIVEFRKTFFEDSYIRKGQMIVANWGRGTTIRLEGTADNKQGYSDSGSTIYLSLETNHGEYTVKEILPQPLFVNNIGEAQRSGLEYFLSKDYEIWKIQEDIQVAFYSNKKGYRQNARHNITERRYLPYIIHKYNYCTDNMLKEDLELRCDCLEANEILQTMGKERASKDVKACTGKSCKECMRFYIDALVSLCLGEEILEEYLVSEERSKRAVQTLHQDCKDKEKKACLEKLVKCLAEKKFPERFGEFKENDNFCFVVNYDAAQRGGNDKYNLELQRENRNSKRILVAFLGYMSLPDVQEKYIAIKKSVSEERQADILLYYVDDNGRQVYSEPYEQTSISIHNNDFCRNIESIM